MARLSLAIANRMILLLVGCLCLGLLLSLPVRADDSDYDQPAHWILPWSCKESHRITWEPEDHWANGKARGVAYDFSFRTGTPLHAPVAGRAYFLHDERPLATNFGHYVEIVTHDGQWLVRLAHLRDPQQGEHDVEAGEIIGYSGSSGVPVEHLHLEILVNRNQGWARPDLNQFTKLFGIERSRWIEGAILSNNGCPAHLIINALHMDDSPIRLGDAKVALLTLHNEGLEPIEVSAIQVLANGPNQVMIMEEAQGDWWLGPRASLWVPLTIRPTSTGEWQIETLVCETSEGVSSFALDEGFRVKSSLLHAEISTDQSTPTVRAGDQVEIVITLRNDGDTAQQIESLYVIGARPDATPWEGDLGGPLALEPGEEQVVNLASHHSARMVGEWTVTEIGYQKGQRRFALTRPSDTLQVEGPELVARDLSIHTNPQQLLAMLHIANIGSEPVSPDRFEVWGWLPQSDAPLILDQENDAPIPAGHAALIQLAGHVDVPENDWQLVGAGYWLDGDYVPILLPEQVDVVGSHPLSDPVLAYDHFR